MTDTTQQSVAWLVESEPGGLWWDGRFVSRGIDPRFFTRDPNEAVRFARREDAEKVAASSSALKATEHVWMADAQPQQAATGPVEFDHAIGADRYKVVKGSFWWHIRIGDGTANVGKFHTKLAAEDMALKLLIAFRDGAFLQSKAAQHQQAANEIQVNVRPSEWRSMSPEAQEKLMSIARGRKVGELTRRIRRQQGEPAEQPPQD